MGRLACPIDLKFAFTLFWRYDQAVSEPASLIKSLGMGFDSLDLLVVDTKM